MQAEAKARSTPVLSHKRAAKTDIHPIRGRKTSFILNASSESTESFIQREWLLTDGLGGYSSSTALGLNTRKYHALLAYADENLERRIVLSKLDEEVVLTESCEILSINEYADGTITDGFKHLKEFNCTADDVQYKYVLDGIEVVKTICRIPRLNALWCCYTLSNDGDSDFDFKVRPLTNSRNIHGLSKKRENFTVKDYLGHGASVSTSDDYLLLYSKEFSFINDAFWHGDVFYRIERERGENAVEDLFNPGVFSIKVNSGEKIEATILAVAGAGEDFVGEKFRQVLNHKRMHTPLNDGGIYTLVQNNHSFIIDAFGKKTVIAGYPWFGDWGRDALISLPGLTLVSKKFSDAELILEHFLNHVERGRTPTRFAGGKPQYYDADGSLWLIDRVHKYLSYVQPSKAKQFLHTYWWTLKEIVENHAGMVRDGVLVHDCGTWMDSLRRESGVEIQALWYNALNCMQDMAETAGDSVDYSGYIEDHRRVFLEKYWNGEYLRDCLGDDSMRPNQVIALSLNYTVLGFDEAKKILDAVEKQLLTPYGLRTLSPKNPLYCGVYTGGVVEREKAYHNGTVWPWLLGPYFKALRKYGLERDVKRKWEFIQPLLTSHLWDAGIGYLSEIFDGDPPHKPRGCIAQAWSMAEISRAYFEDVNPASRD